MRLMPPKPFSIVPIAARALCISACLLISAPLQGVAAEAQGMRSGQDEIAETLRAYFDEEFAEMLQAPWLLEAIREQNTLTNALTEKEILDLDQQWRAQVGEQERPMVDAVIHGPATEKLLHKIARAGGVVAEIFVMDAQGLNVIAAAPTSDYWQGDEAKFQNSFGAGVDGMEIGEIEFDASIGISQAQVSATIVDPATGEPIGAVTVGVVADFLL